MQLWKTNAPPGDPVVKLATAGVGDALKGDAEAMARLLMGGLLGGLKSGYGEVATWVSGVASGIGSQLDTAVAGASGLSLAAGGISVSTPPSSAEALLREIAALLRDQPTPVVHNYLDGEPLRAMTREEIAASTRDTVRRTSAGAGVTF